MTAAWIVPSAADVKSAYASVFVPQDEGDTINPETIIAIWLPQAVALVRGAIGAGNVNPLSLTVGSVPPEAIPHVWTLTAEMAVVNTPRLVGYIVLEGENGPMSRAITAARTFLTKCSQGMNVTTPTDPDPANTPTGGGWGDFQGVGSSTTVLPVMTTDGGTLL